MLTMQCYSVPYIGEFGIVYKAHIVKHKDGQVVTEIMAVKTLKGEPDNASMQLGTHKGKSYQPYKTQPQVSMTEVL